MTNIKYNAGKYYDSIISMMNIYSQRKEGEYFDLWFKDKMDIFPEKMGDRCFDRYSINQMVILLGNKKTKEIILNENFKEINKLEYLINSFF